MKKLLSIIGGLVVVAVVVAGILIYNNRDNETYISTYVFDREATNLFLTEEAPGFAENIAQGALDTVTSAIQLRMRDETRFVWSFMGITDEGTYKIEGDKITLTKDDGDMEGTLVDDKIVLQVQEDGEGVTMVLVKKEEE